MQYISVAYDAGSRSPGAACRGAQWAKLLKEKSVVEFPREHGRYMPAMLRLHCLNLARRRVPFILLGGDHSVTFDSLLALRRVYSNITVVLFDAHHDAYTEPVLSHYSVFHHTRSLGVRCVRIGVRYDVEEVAIDDDWVAYEAADDGVVYISLDVDFFDPALMSSVGHAVPSTIGTEYSSTVLARALSPIRHRIVAADIVEWHSNAASEQEATLVRAAFEVLDAKVRASWIE